MDTLFSQGVSSLLKDQTSPEAVVGRAERVNRAGSAVACLQDFPTVMFRHFYQRLGRFIAILNEAGSLHPSLGTVCDTRDMFLLVVVPLTSMTYGGGPPLFFQSVRQVFDHTSGSGSVNPVNWVEGRNGKWWLVGWLVGSRGQKGMVRTRFRTRRYAYLIAVTMIGIDIDNCATLVSCRVVDTVVISGRSLDRIAMALCPLMSPYSWYQWYDRQAEAACASLAAPNSSPIPSCNNRPFFSSCSV